jgi:hypothetical protein
MFSLALYTILCRYYEGLTRSTFRIIGEDRKLDFLR